MASDQAIQLLRAGLLEGVGILVAGASGSAAKKPAEPVADTVATACGLLGARVAACGLLGGGVPDESELEQDVERALAEVGAIDMLVLDVGALARAVSLPERGGADGVARNVLIGSLEESWKITRAVVNAAFLNPGRPGRVVYLAPAPDRVGGGGYIEATVAGLENLARTLSIEWAHHTVTTVAIAPASDTGAGELATLCGYLASSAGAYFSGCLLDLRGARRG